MVEQFAVNEEVVSSNLTPGANWTNTPEIWGRRRWDSNLRLLFRSFKFVLNSFKQFLTHQRSMGTKVDLSFISDTTNVKRIGQDIEKSRGGQWCTISRDQPLWGQSVENFPERYSLCSQGKGFCHERSEFCIDFRPIIFLRSCIDVTSGGAPNGTTVTSFPIKSMADVSTPWLAERVLRVKCVHTFRLSSSDPGCKSRCIYAKQNDYGPLTKWQ